MDYCDCISRIGIEGDEFGKWTCRSCKKEVFNKNRKEIKTMDYEKIRRSCLETGKQIYSRKCKRKFRSKRNFSHYSGL